MTRKISWWSCFLTGLVLLAGPLGASPGPRSYRVCDTFLTAKGMAALTPQLHIYLPGIHKFLALIDHKSPVLTRALVHSPSDMDFHTNIEIDKVYPRAVRFPRITQDSDITLSLNEDTTEAYFYRHLLTSDGPLPLLNTHWLDQSWFEAPTPERMALLFIALSMTERTQMLLIQLPLETQHGLAERMKMQLARVKAGEIELDRALLDLDSRFYNELQGHLPLKPEKLEIVEYGPFGGMGGSVLLGFKKL